VRLLPGANPAAARRTLQRLVPGDGGSVSSVQRPAEIVNYRSMGTTPAFLGAALAAAAVTALGLTLIASIRRRRRDLALLKPSGSPGASWQLPSPGNQASPSPLGPSSASRLESR